MGQCKQCHEKVRYLEGKAVCIRCDELLFDLEIELDEKPVEAMAEARATIWRSIAKIS